MISVHIQVYKNNNFVQVILITCNFNLIQRFSRSRFRLNIILFISNLRVFRNVHV